MLQTQVFVKLRLTSANIELTRVNLRFLKIALDGTLGGLCYARVTDGGANFLSAR